MKKNIYVTSPTLPDLHEYTRMLEKIWENKQITNIGIFHNEFEAKLTAYLGVQECSLFCNGTLALMIALKALRLSGEVITTPFTFVATTDAIYWNDIQPVFCDIEEGTFNLDPKKIEALITNKTTAIMPVHVYGNPCNIEAIQEIADMYGLKVIYDAAHAFGVRINGEPIANFGDLSVLSFHATKVFNTVEGGAIVHQKPHLKKRIDFLKNFGFADETIIIGTGINAKQNELLSAYGILQLESFGEEVKKRKIVAERYRENLRAVEGIRCLKDIEGVQHNYSYFPVLFNSDKSGTTRDSVYHALREQNILSRRYFYPLTSHIPAYCNLPSANPENLKVAERIALQVLCLPIYGDLDLSIVDDISDIIRQKLEQG